ncbi:hypothetical protein SOASR016_04790 [Pectobacterium carotovorum subsp. carotovorum]|uniref:Uncharacterized protein n=1 Tax=Pectobacterium carotovorum subsp. carotovorum TaxID=555 RepID=A0ABQ5L1B8_PECCC|nr:hypothetical protein SOASR016_04790 [Pectobacterium carotovorum subsp. carotovorum]
MFLDAGKGRRKAIFSPFHTIALIIGANGGGEITLRVAQNRAGFVEPWSKVLTFP